MTMPAGGTAQLCRALPRALFLTFMTLASASPAAAVTQSWNGYRWARTGPLSVRVGDNVSTSWDLYLNTAIKAWSAARNIDFVRASGRTIAASCAPVYGGVQACSGNYGANGWLGYTNVWLSGGFIVQATVRLNDYYLKQPAYNTAAWRQNTICHELGHSLGLDHNDSIKTNANKGTCMDYTRDPSGKLGSNGTKANLNPGVSDFTALDGIYAKLNTSQLSYTKPQFRIGDGLYIDGRHDVETLVAVPEPASWALLIIGFCAVGVLQRRRRCSPETSAR